MRKRKLRGTCKQSPTKIILETDQTSEMTQWTRIPARMLCNRQIIIIILLIIVVIINISIITQVIIEMHVQALIGQGLCYNNPMRGQIILNTEATILLKWPLCDFFTFLKKK